MSRGVGPAVARTRAPHEFTAIRSPLWSHESLFNRAIDPLQECSLAAQASGVVYDALFAGGQAAAELDRLASVVRASGLIDAATLEKEVSAIRGKLEAQAALGPKPAPVATSATPTAADAAAATPSS